MKKWKNGYTRTEVVAVIAIFVVGILVGDVISAGCVGSVGDAVKITNLEKENAKLKADHKKVLEKIKVKWLEMDTASRKESIERVLGSVIASGAPVSKIPGLKIPRVRIHIDNTADGVKITYLVDVVYNNPGVLDKPHEFQVEVSKEVYGDLKLPKP